MVRDCYTGHTEKIEGLARLSLQDDSREAIRVGKLLPVSAQRVGAGRTLEEFDGPLITKLGDFRSERKVPHHPIRRN